MDGPFRSWYQKPTQQRRSYSYNPSLFGVPVYPVDPTRQARQSAYADRQPPVEEKPGRKVVQIPVQFFGSDSGRRSESALRIQKVFRGFVVRKSVRKIKEIRAQVDEIEARLLRDEVVEMIRGNERERLRMSETLMNLLLRLDGIRGIDLGIRVCRKGVTRKAIALQEKIDAICAPDSEGNVDDKVETGNQELEDAVAAAEFVGIELSPENGVAAELEGSRFEENSNGFEQILDDSGEESKGLNGALLECEKMEIERDSVLTEESDVVVASEVNPSEETHVEMETCKNIDFDEDNVESVKEMLVQYNGKDMVNGEGKEDEAIGNCEFLANSGVPVASVVEATPETCCPVDEGDAEIVKDRDTLQVEDETMDVEREHLDAESVDVVKACQETQGVQETPEDICFGVERAETMKETSVERNGEDLNKRKCELLEQMMEENKKMMLMVTQLYDRNETQLQMLDALTNRVDFLEKAYLCDKLRNRRKKMKKNKCALTCIED
ncbi:uncharacterized protein LOC142539191 [Primulina tabacum]|uniref:uncharacterized protein LOC142539191 n=1 Tax=Primulina tabacum TaxID=48773 RepID=UPI003F5956DB